VCLGGGQEVKKKVQKGQEYRQGRGMGKRGKTLVQRGADILWKLGQRGGCASPCGMGNGGDGGNQSSTWKGRASDPTL